MPFPTLPLALLAPFAVAVSGGVTSFNVEPSCKGGLDSPGLNERYSRCIQQEGEARSKLQATWTQYPAGDRASCGGTARIGTPSYVELLTCLELARDAARLKKN